MSKRSKLSFAFVAAAALSLACAATAFAQKPDAFAAGEQQAAAQNPPGVSFVVRTKDGQTRFRQGELIRLELAFSSSVPDTYSLDSPATQRGWMDDADTFHLDPQGGTSDPLYDYFHFGYGFNGGGLRSNAVLGAKPYVAAVDLNEWFRFDRPGRYRLYLSSSLVSRKRPGGGGGTFTVTSNVIEFEVVPAEPAWAKQTLAQAAGVIDSRDQRADMQSACRALRFLDTEDAVREMVKRFDGRDANNGCEFEYDLGLRGTPRRALAVSEMERQLAAPDHAVTAEFIEVLAFLSFLQQTPAPLPPYPEHGDDEAIKSWRKEFDSRWSLYNETIKSYAERLAAAVFAKEGAARAVSLDTLVSLRANDPRSKKTPEEAQADKSLTGALVSVFGELPPGTQARLLEFEWPQVASPAMLPALRRIYQNPPKEDARLPGDALRRIYELAPDEGRRLIIEEMRRKPYPRVQMDVLGMLPDETLPEVDSLVVERLGADSGASGDVPLGLVERYATAAVSPQLKAAYEEKIGLMACEPQSALLGYFLRVEPSYGAGLVEKALASREKTGCYKSVFTEGSQLPMTPELERIAVTSLDDADSELAADAAGILGSRGSAGARDALLQRFERWHEEWAGREKELSALDEKDISKSQTRVEAALVRALATSPAWLADKELLERLRQLCVTKNCRREADSALGQFDTSVTVYFNPADGSVMHASLAQYNVISWAALKEKVTQFPKGTTFKWSSDSPGSEADERAFGELKAHVERAGMKLTR